MGELTMLKVLTVLKVLRVLKVRKALVLTVLNPHPQHV